jgi:hypothetical protein
MLVAFPTTSCTRPAPSVIAYGSGCFGRVMMSVRRARMNQILFGPQQLNHED